MELLTAGLGKTWEILRNTYKPFACGVVTHPAIDGIVRLQRQRAITPSEVESIQVSVHKRVLEICGNAEPRTGLEGKFSIYHCCAIALVDRAAGEAQFSDARVLDPTVLAVRSRLTVMADEELRPEQAVIAIQMRDGSQLRERVESAVGTLQNPMSDADLEGKFLALATPVLGTEGAAEVLRVTWQLDDLAAMPDMLQLCTPARSGA
jgi:2-methylcitrate dehydratase PrpD